MLAADESKQRTIAVGNYQRRKRARHREYRQHRPDAKIKLAGFGGFTSREDAVDRVAH
ncbi:MAG TPA: hypothetical protein VNI36_02000 [Candidatus Dormibacteraeota bacterium]|nr:hypothetical protein [Candidatus Dormibacteraeota bacterium]